MQNSWDESFCDSLTGEMLPSSDETSNTDDQLAVVGDAYLHIDVLLAAILSKRKNFSERHPEFYFSLVSVVGRVANLVIVFNWKRKACSIGIFVNVDILTGFWEEGDWVKGKDMNSTSMRNWCHSLGINRRMEQLRAGPFSVTTEHSVDWSYLVREQKGVDHDSIDDFDAEFWKDFVLAEKAVGTESHQTRSAPKLVSMASIYPDCQIISNYALLKCKPVLSMHAKDAPVQLYYG
ncbi:MAG: hypothetical protein SGARI_006222 [Bacillariaceae sp.]